MVKNKSLTKAQLIAMLEIHEDAMYFIGGLDEPEYSIKKHLNKLKKATLVKGIMSDIRLARETAKKSEEIRNG